MHLHADSKDCNQHAHDDLSLRWPHMKHCRQSLSWLISLNDDARKKKAILNGLSDWSIFMYWEGRIRSEREFAQSDRSLRYSFVDN